MIKFRNVSFRYASSKPFVLDNVSMDLQPGHIYGLLGKNGVGKSTMFRLISGLNPVTQGSVLTLHSVPFKRSPLMLQDIFLLPEEIDFPAMTALKYGSLYGAFYPKFSLEKMKTYLEQFNIRLDQKLNTMSQGQRKKAYIAFALACNTRILLMDEPTNGLDIPSKTIFRKMLATCQGEERLIIISTHQVRDLERLIDAVIIMEEQHLALCDTAENLLKTFHFGAYEPEAEVIYHDDTERGRIGLTLRGDAPVQTLDDLDLEILFNAMVMDGEQVLEHLQMCSN
jgi:ABC-2 type transport system ATP-binding protein